MYRVASADHAAGQQDVHYLMIRDAILTNLEDVTTNSRLRIEQHQGRHLEDDSEKKPTYRYYYAAQG